MTDSCNLEVFNRSVLISQNKSLNLKVCNRTAVVEARQRMEDGKIEVSKKLSWGRLQFKVYWWIVDYMLSAPYIGPLMKPYLPLIGFIIMITI